MSEILDSLILSHLHLLIAFYLTINIISFILFGFDKYQSRRNGFRISENILLGIAFLGGALGGLLGMRLFRHKTLHFQFSLGLPLILFIQCVVFFIIIIFIVT